MEESKNFTQIDLYYIYLQRFYSINHRLIFTEGPMDRSTFNDYYNNLKDVRGKISEKEYIPN
jgi:hypothetical protein